MALPTKRWRKRWTFYGSLITWSILLIGYLWGSSRRRTSSWGEAVSSWGPSWRSFQGGRTGGIVALPAGDTG
jgi:hypothetical protein